MATVSDLDAKALEVLEAVYECGGEADTSEIKEYTGIQKNGIIHYRYEKLEEAGLIETRTGEMEGTKMPATVAEVTEEAREQIEGGLFAEEEGTVVERMDRLERQQEHVLEEVKGMQREFKNWRFDPETDEEIMAWELADRIEELDDLAEDIEDAEALVERLDEMEDTVDWADRSIQSQYERLEELEDRLAELEGEDSEKLDVDEMREEVETARSDARVAKNRAQKLEGELQDAKEAARDARRDAREAKNVNTLESGLPSGSFIGRLKWLLTGSDVS
jgi:chromosome segregation ATPase